MDTRLQGTCRALYALDVARGIGLKRAAERLTTSRPTAFHHKQRLPGEPGTPPPLRLTWSAVAPTEPRVANAGEPEVTVYEQGAVCISWPIPFDGSLEDLVELSVLLYDNAELTRRSREIAREVLEALGDAAVRPRLAPQIEDYVVFEALPPRAGGMALLRGTPSDLARVLRAEVLQLSEQEVADALAHPVAYGVDDVCLVDWLAAFLVGNETGDERMVLELATVELLELRLLDAQLDTEIEEAYQYLGRRHGLFTSLAQRRRESERVARMQADGAFLHEGIDNALKLFGDDYLARLYRQAGERFHFNDWDASIQRKLDMLRGFHDSLAGTTAHRRAEVLEWIIIVLIAVEIVLFFFPAHA
jgi:hypothetical protein